MQEMGEMTETFSCEFPGGLRCTAVTQKPGPNQSHNFLYEWTAQPTPEIFPQFKEWMHTVNMEISRKWDRPIKHVFAFTDNKAEVWDYAPGQPPMPGVL